VLPLVILLCLLSLTVSTRSVLCIKIRHYQTLSSTVSCTGSGRVGLGQSADGLGWIGSHKMDPWTSLLETKPVSRRPKLCSSFRSWSRRFGLGLENKRSPSQKSGLDFDLEATISVSTISKPKCWSRSHSGGFVLGLNLDLGHLASILKV